MKTVLIPAENEKDLRDVPADIVKALDIRLVNDADEVLPLALLAGRDEIFSFEASHALAASLRMPRAFAGDLGGAVL